MELFDINTYTNDKIITEINIQMPQGVDTIDEILQSIDYAKNVLLNMPVGFSDVEKSLWIKHYVLGHTIYMENYYGLYNALVLGRSVCDGLAKEYQLICVMSGIECHYVSSISRNHAWNLIRINDYYYHVDCTNSDGGFMETDDEYNVPRDTESGTIKFWRNNDSFLNAFWKNNNTTYYTNLGWTKILCDYENRKRYLLLGEINPSDGAFINNVTYELKESNPYETKFQYAVYNNELYYVSSSTHSLYHLNLSNNARETIYVMSDEEIKEYSYLTFGIKNTGVVTLYFHASGNSEIKKSRSFNLINYNECTDDVYINGSDGNISWVITYSGILKISGIGKITRIR